MARRLAFGVVVVALVAVAAPGTALAKERCCLKTTITQRGVLSQDFDEGSDASIGEANADWSWAQRMVLVYGENGTAPYFRLARFRGREIRPSVTYFGNVTSSVQIKQPDGTYKPFADPNDCGQVTYKSRRQDVPTFTLRKYAAPGPKASFPNANVFLTATFPVTFDNNDGCLFGGSTVSIDDWRKEPCSGSGGFALPAPRRAWFRHGSGRIEREDDCTGSHHEPSNDRYELAVGLVKMAFQWFPPSQLEEYVKRLNKAHQNAKPPS